ncbi:hypothetical protein HMF7854_00140 [Sphingomonas ginkgonis]|uniref:Uncharacterized protein n=1 Tax=Sphingomonas ginkgonis TaxID=2315330 RepID=A0A429V653_9SPHN|nr:hypothetical protein [Sphingomonas ginkgonis]RST29417.1 hypothetical protein HMF7854_00140 [Sphingomonas ginkgonis]
MLLMVSLALLLSLGALAPPSSGDALKQPIELVKPEVAAARVAACGFKSVRPKFDDTQQEDVVEVSKVASASKEQLECVARASLQTHYYVTLPAPVEQTYQTLYWQMSRERDKADAKAWLDKRGLLARLPLYDPKRSDEATFARTLEKLCGPRATGSLKTMEEHSAGNLDEETLWCLVNAASASGYPLGFIGNEAYKRER